MNTQERIQILELATRVNAHMGIRTDAVLEAAKRFEKFVATGSIEDISTAPKAAATPEAKAQ